MKNEASGVPPARERILGAAMKAFMELGYAQTSTLEIATRAQVSKREIYALFGSKQAILAACVADRAQRMRLPPNCRSLARGMNWLKCSSGSARLCCVRFASRLCWVCFGSRSPKPTSLQR